MKYQLQSIAEAHTLCCMKPIPPACMYTTSDSGANKALIENGCCARCEQPKCVIRIKCDSFESRKGDQSDMKKTATVTGIKTTYEAPAGVIIRKTNEYLKCEFTQKELEEMSSEMAMKFQELSSYATKIKETESRIKTLSDNVSSRSEIRSVRCEWHMNAPKKGKKTLFRTDTGDTVRIDDMLDSDCQMVLDDLKKSEKTLDEKNIGRIEPEPENHEIVDEGSDDGQV